MVLGSVNMDITIDVARLPLKGETTTSVNPTVSLAVGGKVRLAAQSMQRYAVPLLLLELCQCRAPASDGAAVAASKMNARG